MIKQKVATNHVMVLVFALVIGLCVGLSPALVNAQPAYASHKGKVTTTKVYKKNATKAKKAYKKFLKNKKGYYSIVRLSGTKTPVLLWAKWRLSGEDENLTNVAKVYTYTKGKVKYAGTAENSSSGEWLTIYKGKLRFGEHIYTNYVTVKHNKFSGVRYSAKWINDNTDIYYAQKITNGKLAKVKKRVSEKTGIKMLYGSVKNRLLGRQSNLRELNNLGFLNSYPCVSSAPA